MNKTLRNILLGIGLTSIALGGLSFAVTGSFNYIKAIQTSTGENVEKEREVDETFKYEFVPISTTKTFGIDSYQPYINCSEAGVKYSDIMEYDAYDMTNVRNGFLCHTAFDDYEWCEDDLEISAFTPSNTFVYYDDDGESIFCANKEIKCSFFVSSTIYMDMSIDGVSYESFRYSETCEPFGIRFDNEEDFDNFVSIFMGCLDVFIKSDRFWYDYSERKTDIFELITDIDDESYSQQFSYDFFKNSTLLEFRYPDSYFSLCENGNDNLSCKNLSYLDMCQYNVSVFNDEGYIDSFNLVGFDYVNGCPALVDLNESDPVYTVEEEDILHTYFRIDSVDKDWANYNSITYQQYINIKNYYQFLNDSLDCYEFVPKA